LNVLHNETNITFTLCDGLILSVYICAYATMNDDDDDDRYRYCFNF